MVTHYSAVPNIVSLCKSRKSSTTGGVILNLYKLSVFFEYMKVMDVLSVIFLFIVLFIALFILWYNLPGVPIEFQEYKFNVSGSLPGKSYQFYPNMRYPDRVIGYSDEACSHEKKRDFERAIEVIEQNTILDFTKSNSPQIVVFCSDISPKPEEEGHFIAGEGGPTEIVNASKYAVILAGKISLYRPESCDKPQVAIHELLHALGFDHNNNEKSIIYPVTNCNQELDQEIINEINFLYSDLSYADLLIEDLQANKSGRYLNFDIVIANHGLRKAENFTLNLKIGGAIINSFNIGKLDIGSKKSLSVSNLKIPRNTQEIIFEVKSSQPELSKTNNIVKIGLIGG